MRDGRGSAGENARCGSRDVTKRQRKFPLLRWVRPSEARRGPDTKMLHCGWSVALSDG